MLGDVGRLVVLFPSPISHHAHFESFACSRTLNAVPNQLALTKAPWHHGSIYAGLPTPLLKDATSVCVVCGGIGTFSCSLISQGSPQCMDLQVWNGADFTIPVPETSFPFIQAWNWHKRYTSLWHPEAGFVSPPGLYTNWSHHIHMLYMWRDVRSKVHFRKLVCSCWNQE